VLNPEGYCRAISRGFSFRESMKTEYNQICRRYESTVLIAYPGSTPDTLKTWREIYFSESPPTLDDAIDCIMVDIISDLEEDDCESLDFLKSLDTSIRQVVAETTMETND
jgi:hypothetical protein